ncbi:MAG: winged helix-turn-helix domain-containing protein [Pseudomonadota bacterium]
MGDPLNVDVAQRDGAGEVQKTDENSGTYTFGEFHLSVPLRELRKNQDSVDIQKRVLDLLIFLVEQRHRTVSKDEIQDAVWPGTIVTEAALTRAIMKARRAVEDDANTQAIIKTVHGQGYRFVAPVGVGVDRAAQQEAQSLNSVRRQALLRVATTYGAGAWLLNQAAAMVWEAFEWERWPQQLLLAISVIGFPVVLAITWFYRSTPSGLALRSESRVVPTTSSRRRDKVVIATLLAALVLSVAWNFRDQALPVASPEARIAVLPLHNATDDVALGWVSLGMMSLISDQLRRADFDSVAPASVLQEVPQAAQPDVRLLERLQATQAVRWVVDAQLHKAGTEYLVRGRVFNDLEEEALPDAAGATPSAAVDRWTEYLIAHLRPRLSEPRARLDSGDLFVDQAYARGMHEVLSGNLEQARDLLRVAVNARPEAFEPAYELTSVLRRLGDLDAAKARALELLDAAREDQRGYQISGLCNELGVIHDLTADLDASAQFYEEGLEWARRDGLHQRRAILLINYAILARAQGDSLRQRQLLGQAKVAYDDAGIRELPGDFHLTLGNSAADEGDIEGARASYRAALVSYRAAARPQGEGIALSNLSWASQKLNDFPAAFEYLEQSQALREKIGDRVGVLRSTVRRADLSYQVGRFGDARQLAQTVIDSSYAQRERELQATAFTILGYIDRDRGALSQAAAHFATAEAIDTEDERLYGQLRAHIALGQVALDEARFADTVQRIEKVMALTAAGEVPLFRTRAMLLRGRLQAARGNTAEAIVELEAAAQRARTTNNEADLLIIAEALAELFAREQDPTGVETWVGVASAIDSAAVPSRLAALHLALLRDDRNQAVQLLDAIDEQSGERYLRRTTPLRAALPP